MHVHCSHLCLYDNYHFHWQNISNTQTYKYGVFVVNTMFKLLMFYGKWTFRDFTCMENNKEKTVQPCKQSANTHSCDMLCLCIKFHFIDYLRFGQWLRIYLSDPLVTCIMMSILRDTIVVRQGATAFKYGSASFTYLTSRCFRFCKQASCFPALYHTPALFRS